MATNRYIQVSFWTDPKIADDFTPQEKYFYLYLLTNPHTNLCGCYELSVRQMCIETGYSTEDICVLIDRFALIHNIMRYSRENKEVLLFNWHKYNWTSSNKLRAAILNSIKTVKTEEFKDYLMAHFENRNTQLDETELKTNGTI